MELLFLTMSLCAVAQSYPAPKSGSWTAKPSNGLRAKFPRYNYTDMVAAQHRLVSEGLGVKHVRLVLDNSMGGMQVWMRRLIIDSIRNDPEWMGGNYTNQPRSAQFASVFFATATSGGNQALQRLAPTSDKADQLLDGRLKAPFTGDANDNLYQWESSRDYNPLAGLEKNQGNTAGHQLR